MVRERNPAREYYQRTAEGDTWALAAQLGAEELYFNRRGSNVMLDLAYHLLPPKKTKRIQDMRAVLWSGMVARIAGTEEILADVKSPDGGEKYLSQLKPRLVALLDSSLPAVERAEAGRVLAKLGDPRREVLDVMTMQFCLVPAGPFIFGESKGQKNEKLPTYWVAKYPVTNVQFNQFVAAGGYEQPGFWKEAIKEEYWENGAFKDDAGPRHEPADYGEPFTLENHPVVGISWYEALAFTRWLDALFKERSTDMLAKVKSDEDKAPWQGLVSGRLHVTLPTEAEWEKAACGTDGREYPWGEEADPNLANYHDTGVGTTNAVGCFPGGKSIFGGEEMSGNVWEWTASLERDRSPIFRGGSFGSGSKSVRCAPRHSGPPGPRHSRIGFRIVVSPLLS